MWSLFAVLLVIALTFEITTAPEDQGLTFLLICDINSSGMFWSVLLLCQIKTFHGARRDAVQWYAGIYNKVSGWKGTHILLQGPAALFKLFVQHAHYICSEVLFLVTTSASICLYISEWPLRYPRLSLLTFTFASIVSVTLNIPPIVRTAEPWYSSFRARFDQVQVVVDNDDRGDHQEIDDRGNEVRHPQREPQDDEEVLGLSVVYVLCFAVCTSPEFFPVVGCTILMKLIRLMQPFMSHLHLLVSLLWNVPSHHLIPFFISALYMALHDTKNLVVDHNPGFNESSFVQFINGIGTSLYINDLVRLLISPLLILLSTGWTSSLIFYNIQKITGFQIQCNETWTTPELICCFWAHIYILVLITTSLTFAFEVFRS